MQQQQQQEAQDDPTRSLLTSDAPEQQQQQQQQQHEPENAQNDTDAHASTAGKPFGGSQREHPLTQASWLSQLYWLWLWPLLLYGRKRFITVSCGFFVVVVFLPPFAPHFVSPFETCFTLLAPSASKRRGLS